MQKVRAAAVGIGEVPSGRFPERSEIEAAILACRDAILDAGMAPTDIDVVMPVGALASRHFNVDLVFSRLCEELGMLRSAKMNVQVMSGGATSSSMLAIAEGLIAGGLARNVLCIHSDAVGSLPKQAGIDLFSTTGVSEEWEAPYGHNMNAVGALAANRYMHETGTTEEELASVCVALRQWAQLNPHAMFRTPLTIEEVLASKMVATPLRAKHCNMLADGAAAFIVARAEDAPHITKTPVYVRGHGSLVTHYTVSQDTNLARLGFEEAGAEAYAKAGIGPEHMQLAQIYDAYPVWPLITLDGLKLCRGERAGAFVAAGETSPGGSLPMTTNGGMLSQGHTAVGGGIAVLVEAFRQLMGKAGERQVANLVNAVETASGGTWMDSHVTILSKEY
ncbi:thiolase family protein [Mesorhizobium sp. CGMCC 1.15528]|uniref:Thiolase family protein n=1 Tax=Mesorhizobium zhangyense TaxID=1776730 RepID=A0A7C9VFC0_9HYPH|nr:thiolase family protein [Mesorhizobium zhangyense]NGN44029.1 thiolase family protein [Mesorhizobium zhangyense]